MRSPVAVSVVTEHDAISPAPTNTGSLPGAVLKVQVGPVVVSVPSLTVAYHSNVWPAPRLDQVVVVVAPEATAVFWAIWAKTPLAERATEEGHGQRVTVRVGHADAQGRRGADAGGGIRRGVQGRRRGRVVRAGPGVVEREDLGGGECGARDAHVVEQAGVLASCVVMGAEC